MVGAGVLGLPYALSYLGWAGGLTALTLLTAASIYTSYLLAALHECATPHRLNDYQAMGRAILGPRLAAWLVSPVQNVLLIGLCITYSIAAGQNLRGLLAADCEGAACARGIGPWILGFGAVELLASQLPDIHAIWWISLIGAAMSLTYTTIASAVSFRQLATEGAVAGAAAPRADSGAADHVFGVFNALGSVGFTFGGQGVLPEIQATLAIPRGRTSTLQPMMISVAVAYVVIVCAYYAVAIGGYATYGSTVAADVLMSLQGPRWLRKTANAAVVVHMAAAYQVFAQPIFALIEAAWARRRLGARLARQTTSDFANDDASVVANGNDPHHHHPNYESAFSSSGSPRRSSHPHPARAPLRVRLALRTLFVVLVTLVALVMPFFAEVMGIFSSLGLIPMSFVLPCVFWLVAVRPRGLEKWLNIAIATSCGVLSLLSLIGGTRNVIVQLRNRGQA